ncbi:MAG: U32 family peptidase, partial [Gammaproteobacteria bacterium]|nr:U32 family peptidase [Gammaproteobacteria bacterium]
MTKEIELLAPGGDIDSIKAAIVAGANAVYCGLDRFNARGRAKNITFDDLQGILRLAHKHDCEIFLTVNIIIVESELTALFNLLNKLVNTSLDGIIVQDLGLLYLLNRYYPSLKIHASTQLTTHNEGQIKFLNRLNATRVNLSRELNIEEITHLTSVAHDHGMLTEVFVHGSNCISFSGLCYMSSVNGGNSGNRGRCSQPCRDQYLTTAEGVDFPLNIKDNSAFSDLNVLADAGVDSIKIEGRIKKYHYVHTVVSTWRKQLQSFYEQNRISDDNSDLRKVFNRDFSNSFLQGEISKSVFIDNPRDNSALHRSEQIGGISVKNLTTAKKELFDIKTEMISNVKDEIDRLTIDRAPLSLQFSGRAGAPLTVNVSSPDSSFDIVSESNLAQTTAATDDNSSKRKSSSKSCFDHASLLKRFKAINETEYFIEHLDLSTIQSDLYIPFKDLTLIKNRILFLLNGSKEYAAPITPPKLENPSDNSIEPALSLLISSKDDLHLCDETDAEICFQLPNRLDNRDAELVELFSNNKNLIPWFPSVLLGDDYSAAVEFLEQVKPARIVTNNSGIAFAANERGIPWLAGPYMNLVNSFSLLCLKEYFNCAGAFISNEINRRQIKQIKRPDDFELIYSIYHPIVLMTSRVCFFHQVTGCKKNIVDDKCIQRCERSSFITNMNDVSHFIKKERGGYHDIFNESNFLNTDIVTEVPNLFTRYFVDLRDIKTETAVAADKLDIVRLFENHISNDTDTTAQLQQQISPTTHTQYVKG